MDIEQLFEKNSCNIYGKKNIKKTRSWPEYFENKKKLEAEGKQVVLVDMINQAIEDSVPISNEMFNNNQYPEGTTFCLYCHSGGDSGYVQLELEKQLPQYNFVNMAGGIGTYYLFK